MKSISEILGRDPVHPFPARMAPSIALDAVSGFKSRMRVLDPMMGSGTVLALARSQGHFASGVDIDPLATLIGQVWTTTIEKDLVMKRAVKILKRAKEDFNIRALSEAYPRNADKETRKFIRYWFDNYARRQLAALSDGIMTCRDKTIRNALWCAFSRLIITKQAGASLALDLSHSRPHKYFRVAPRKPFANFLNSVECVLDNCLSAANKARGPATNIQLGDARDLNIRSNTIDLVLTSPPYLNAIDYMRCSKFSLVWMGRSIANLRYVRRESIGTEIGQYESTNDGPGGQLIKSLRLKSRLSLRHQALLRRFIEDMDGVIRETSRVLAPGGKAIYVIGENTIRGTYVKNSKIIAALADKAGLRLDNKVTRALPQNRRYLPPPARKGRGTLNGRMRREVVLTFSKSNKPRH